MEIHKKWSPPHQVTSNSPSLPPPPPGTRIIKSNYYPEQLLLLRSTLKVGVKPTKAWFPLVLRIIRIEDFYDIPTSGILTTSGNTSSQKSQTVGDFYDVIGRIRIILKVLSQTSQTSAIFMMSVNLAVLRIAIVVRIPVS